MTWCLSLWAKPERLQLHRKNPANCYVTLYFTGVLCKWSIASGRIPADPASRVSSACHHWLNGLGGEEGGGLAQVSLKTRNTLRSPLGFGAAGITRRPAVS